MKNIKTFLLLHLMLIIYSLSSVCSKWAGAEEFLSFKFILFYGGMIFLLGVYAIGWQQVIKKMDLTAAYASKAVTLIWGLVWGVLFFQEQITLKKLIGLLVVAAGVVLFSVSEAQDGAATETIVEGAAKRGGPENSADPMIHQKTTESEGRHE